MKVEQISIFMENKTGRLAEVTRCLAEAKANIRALSLADTSDFGILRLLVDDHEKAKHALKDKGFTVGSTAVVAVEVPDRPGGLDAILQLLSSRAINVEYMYAFVSPRCDNAVLIFRFDRPDDAIAVLQGSQFKVISGEELCSI